LWLHDAVGGDGAAFLAGRFARLRHPARSRDADGCDALLFTISSAALACPAVHLLAEATSAASWRQLVVWLAGFGLLFVGLPFLLLGIPAARPAGPSPRSSLT
jgi:hypothetical protein